MKPPPDTSWVRMEPEIRRHRSQRPVGLVLTTADAVLASLGQQVREARLGACLTQAELAAAVGRSRSSIANIEAGRQGDIPVTLLVAISVALDARFVLR